MKKSWLSLDVLFLAALSRLEMCLKHSPLRC